MLWNGHRLICSLVSLQDSVRLRGLPDDSKSGSPYCPATLALWLCRTLSQVAKVIVWQSRGISLFRQRWLPDLQASVWRFCLPHQQEAGRVDNHSPVCCHRWLSTHSSVFPTTTGQAGRVQVNPVPSSENTRSLDVQHTTVHVRENLSESESAQRFLSEVAASWSQAFP